MISQKITPRKVIAWILFLILFIIFIILFFGTNTIVTILIIISIFVFIYNICSGFKGGQHSKIDKKVISANEFAEIVLGQNIISIGAFVHYFKDDPESIFRDIDIEKMYTEFYLLMFWILHYLNCDKQLYFNIYSLFIYEHHYDTSKSEEFLKSLKQRIIQYDSIMPKVQEDSMKLARLGLNIMKNLGSTNEVALNLFNQMHVTKFVSELMLQVGRSLANKDNFIIRAD